MAYDLKFDRLLRAIQNGEETDAISFFERKLYDVNEAINYLFEDGKRFTVTPLYWAVRHNCPKVCNYLLTKGARPYGTLVYEYYPLHEACSRGYDKVVQEFVNARCEVDKMNNDSDTPLHIACMRGHIQCVHILLWAGSDCNLRNKLGHTPLQCAVYHDRNDLVELFKAHNKGIETTIPRSSAHPQHQSVTTLTATGVKVQRSQSFNAESTSSVQHKKSSPHSRVRSSARPKSYYENDGTSALVIGQPPLSFTQSQSLQSLSESVSGFSTISTGLPHYKISPDSPVERDAPKPTSRTVGPSSRKAQKVYEDYSSKHSGIIQSDVSDPSVPNPPLPCPFPSPGVQKDSTEKQFFIPKRSHPLSASKRSDTHSHCEKLLQERMSHPELHISKRDIQIANRAKSSNDVFSSNSSKRDTRERIPAVSPSRERINSLSTALCDTLELDISTQHHSSLKHDSHLHPLLKSLRLTLATQAHHFGLSPDHHKCLSELTLVPLHSPPSFSSVDSSLSSLLSHQEINYNIFEGPLETEVWREEGEREMYATLVYKVQLCDVLVQLRSQVNQGDIALLKVKVRLDPEMKDGPQSICSSLGQSSDLLPEAVMLQELPDHPNIVSVLYQCRGSTERFRQHLMQQMQSEFHTAATNVSQSHSTLHTESHFGTTECLYGTEDHTTYNPASTGFFLFQSLSGVSIGKYFHDFLQSHQKEVQIEDRFLFILAQLLLAVAHLQKNLISHCAINTQNVYITEKGQKVVLGDFGQALNLRPKNLDVLRKSLRKLKASRTRKLSPEAEKSLASSNVDESSYNVSTLEEAFSKSDSYAVGALFYNIFGKGCLFAESEVPFIQTLSFKCNHLLQKLVARDPSDRFSALQGAISCFVLLFGPRTSDVCSSTDCLRWLVSESLELYLDPVLRDSTLPSNRDNNCARRLHYTYLISANPELVFNSCKFFNND